jgi:2-C-methyl-D-erythritol 4-phosphate cytidylyltransferase
VKKNSAIILAAGKGTRMGGEEGKAFLPLLEKPLVAWPLLVFESSPEIQEIILVVPPGQENKCRKKILSPYNISKAKIVSGGAERQDSLWNGFVEIHACNVVVIHDGARPLLDRETLKNAMDAAEQDGASVVAVPVKDTIKIGDEKKMVLKTLDRNILWAAQTPQAYQYPIIKKALEKAKEDAFYSTDDSSLVERINVPVRIIPGSYENIKVTTPDDVIFGETILRRRLKIQPIGTEK